MMSRRRRVRANDENDEIHSEGEDENNHEKLSYASASASENEDLDVSEYESLEEEHYSSSDGEPEQKHPPDSKNLNAEKKELKSGNEQTDVKEEIGQSNRLTDAKRESGDGKEESDNEHNKLEVINDKETEEKENISEKDPSFIPTKGRFFQHDNRGEDSQPKGRFRERRFDDREPARWSHDMFIMEEQMPKSREHLIEEYGFDLRSKPIDETHPPLRQYRYSRGRGRGGRRQRPPNPQRDGNYQNDYPALKNQGIDVVHKTKSYWKSKERKQTDDMKEQQRSQDAAAAKSDVAKPFKNTNMQIPKSEKGHAVNQEVKPNPLAEKKTDGKFSDLLHVINSHEQGSSSRNSSKQSSNTWTASNNNTSSMNYQESHKPRRYSSLRQRSVNSPVDGQSTNRQISKTQDSRYSNFAKPVHPNATNTTFITFNTALGPNSKPLQRQVIPENQAEAVLTSNSITPAMQPAVSTAQVSGISPYSVAEPQTSIGAPIDASSVTSHPMSMPFNPMMNPMYYEAAAAYQRMMQMSHQMSQMNLEQLQHSHPPPVLPHQTSGTLSAEGQPVPPHISQMTPMIPSPLSQGSLGSVIRAPPPPTNPPTYFSGPIGVNLGMPQQPFPYPPNLMGQQVGGVTYFNTPSPPAIPGTPNQQSSPRRPNAAIPIMAPTGFGLGQME